MFYGSTSQEQNENKIFIYDDLLMNQSSIESYTSEEYADGRRSRSLLKDSDNESLEMNRNMVNGGNQLPLFTIEEGGSSVSSGASSLTSLINGVSNTKCFLNGHPSENTLINANTMQNPLHQYLQTCTSNNSRGKDNIVFEIPPFN